MNNNTRQMASSGPESPFPRDGQFEPTSPLPVVDLREGLDNNMGRGNQRRHRPPLGVELTGYRLLATGMILGLGIPKAVYSFRGQSLISNTVDWVAGIICALVLFWLGVIEANRPELSRRFFQTDLAPPILKFLSRDKRLSCFLSFAYALLATMQLRTAPGSMWDKVDANKITADSDYFNGSSPGERILTVLRLSIYIYFFCQNCLLVVWPRVVKEYRNALAISTVLVWGAGCVYSSIAIFHRGGIGHQQSILVAALLNFPWVYSCTFYTLVRCHYDKHKVHCPHYGLIIAAAMVALKQHSLFSRDLLTFI